MTIDLNQLLLITLEIFVIVLILIGIYIFLILIDVRRTVKNTSKIVNEAGEKIKAVLFILDFATLFKGKFDKSKEKVYKHLLPPKATLISFFAGLKKGLDVLLGGEEK